MASSSRKMASGAPPVARIYSGNFGKVWRGKRRKASEPGTSGLFPRLKGLHVRSNPSSVLFFAALARGQFSRHHDCFGFRCHEFVVVQLQEYVCISQSHALVAVDEGMVPA